MFLRAGVIAAAVVAVLVVPGVAEAAPRAKAHAAATSVCGSPALARTARMPGARAADVDPFNIAKFFGEKAGGALAGKAGEMAFSYITKLPGLKDILPKSDGERMLTELSKIEDQLAGVSARLDQIGTKVDRTISELRTAKLNDALDKACGHVNDAELVYQHYFIPTVQAGLALGEILKSDTPKEAETNIDQLPSKFRQLYTSSLNLTPCSRPSGPQLSCYTPKTLITARLDNFAQAVKDNHVEGSVGLLSNLLRPAELTTSVLTSYGKYLMTKRYLNHGDSESMRALYDDLVQGEALASWMEAEAATYADAQEGGPDGVFKAYLKARDDEKEALPPMIPEGTVIDLQELNGATTRSHPMWTLATTKDETSWPIHAESNDGVTTSADGAATAVTAFNGRACPDTGPCFSSWAIPSTADLKSLMSDNCAISANQLPKTCKPLVNGVAGSPTVVQFLAGLDPANPTWTGVFCNRAAVSCVTPPDEHKFVWTTDRRSHETKCGYEQGIFGIHLPLARTYSLRAGLPLSFTNTNATWPIYPVMPGELPGYHATGYDEGHLLCDTYAREQIANPANKGIVLVTQSIGGVDFMAQPGKSAVQDGAARDVVKHAARDARRYGRHHHGSFRGLSLGWFRGRVPEAHSGAAGYLVAAHPIDGGAGFQVTAQGEGTEDEFSIAYRPSDAVERTCTMGHAGAERHGCQDVRRGEGHW